LTRVMDMNRPTATARPPRPEPSRPGWRAPVRPNYAGRYAVTAPARKETPVLRREIGDVLRAVRLHQNKTLREVSSAAQVSLGYLSEVERGQKEASSELLAAICGALDVPLSVVLREVSDRIAESEGVVIPDTVPELLERSMSPVR